MNKYSKLILTLIITLILTLAFQGHVSACTYEATITGDHIDFSITTDTNNLAVIQYIRLSGSTLVTKMYGPNISTPWSYFDDPNCNIYISDPVGCRQIRFGVFGTSAFWQWYDWASQQYHSLPSGIWSIDFNSVPTYESIGIQYAVVPGTYSPYNWTFCTRTGDVVLPIPTPFPVTKTVFAPGLMASWNADAILNCKSETNTEWVLAPYAEDVYNPILTEMRDNGWDTIPFYYDWRKPVAENSNRLASFLNSEIFASNEKVNFVGHSMGGLVGRGYLDASDGDKLESMLTVGTPNAGSAYAYPPWEGGEIWSNNLLEKIALTIFLRHCGATKQSHMEIIRQEVPSLQDLLPIHPYLKRIKTDSEYLPNISENRNTWLNDLDSDSKGVRLGYLAGTGFETVETIQTKDPNKKDSSQGLWADGKPAGKLTSIQGDGTVLSSSATLPNSSWNAIINQTHRGLVNSSEGKDKILEFLGTPDVNVNNTNINIQEPNSALVVIGYPATFTLTDQNGKTKQSKDGMAAVMNPKEGNYKLNLLPKSDNTLIIVAQFLPNGDIKYKEYRLQGTAPKFKALKFDPQNPRDDIITP